MRRYSEWAGNPAGVPENTNHCVIEVCSNFIPHQCYRKRGHGPEGLYCKQHAAKSETWRRFWTPQDRQSEKGE